MTSQDTAGWWGEVTSAQTRGAVGPERGTDLEEPGGLRWTRAGSVKDTPHGERRGQGSRGPSRVSQKTASHFARRVRGPPRSRLPVPLMPVHLGESRVVCATWLTPGAWHSPAGTRGVVSCPGNAHCRLRSRSPAHPCSPVGQSAPSRETPA